MNNGVPSAVRAVVPVEGATPVDRALDYLRDYRDLYGLGGAEAGLGVRRVVSLADGGAQAVTFHQMYRDVPVYGAEIVIPLQGAEALGSIGELRPRLALDTVPTITAEAAVAAAARPAADPEAQLVVFDPTLLGMPNDRPADKAARLAWRISFGPPVYEDAFVDAASGAVIVRLPLRREAFVITVRTLDDELVATDVNCLYEGRAPDTGDSDAALAEARFKQTYDWYLSSFGRDSYNGLGVPLDVHVHGLFVNEGETSLSAHWSPGCAAFEFSTGMVTPDIVTHEFTHAVTQYRAGLIYFGYAGALNESFSDVMAFLQTGDPLIGDGSSRGTLRDLSNPTVTDANDFTVGEVDSDFEFPDNGNVHTNSGIPNFIAYNIARDPFSGIGDERTAMLYYTALGLHSPSSDFDHHRFAVETAAKMLGFTTAEICEIGREFSAANIGWNDPDCEGVYVELDADQDGVEDFFDNCPETANPLQRDIDDDSQGDACDADDDADGVPDTTPSGGGDNCPTLSNPSQLDANNNGVGAGCDPTEDGDLDNDGVTDVVDNCPDDYNARPQPDSDRDGEGDACDPDHDGDGVGTNGDNCPDVVNANQADGDSDGLGDACDPCPSSADTGVSWSTITYIADDGSVVTDVRPVLADSDSDGTPDSCDRSSTGLRDISIQGRDGDSVSIRPGDEADLIVSGGEGGRFDLVIAICELICTQPPPPDACVAVSVPERDPAIAVSVRDNDGTVARLGADDDTLRFSPAGDTTYELVLALAGVVTDSPLSVTSGRCTDGTPTPTPTSSTPAVSSAPPAGGQLILDLSGTAQVFEAFCTVDQYPPDAGGGYYFGVSGSSARPDGATDHISLQFDIPNGEDPDGTYTTGVIGTVTLGGGGGYNLYNLSVTLRDDGHAGAFAGNADLNGPAVNGTISCPTIRRP